MSHETNMDQVERVTIQQAGRKVFRPPAFKIPRSTIQTWMQQQIFVPAEPAPYRDPKGCRLDLADLVTLGVLRLLINIGVGYESLRKRIVLETPLIPSPSEKPLIRAIRARERRGRGMQGYFETYDYRCHVQVETSVLWTDHEINIKPSASLNNDFIKNLREERNLWTPVTLIPVRPLHDHILKVLQGPPKSD